MARYLAVASSRVSFSKTICRCLRSSAVAAFNSGASSGNVSASTRTFSLWSSTEAALSSAAVKVWIACSSLSAKAAAVAGGSLSSAGLRERAGEGAVLIRASLPCSQHGRLRLADRASVRSGFINDCMARTSLILDRIGKIIYFTKINIDMSMAPRRPPPENFDSEKSNFEGSN